MRPRGVACSDSLEPLAATRLRSLAAVYAPPLLVETSSTEGFECRGCRSVCVPAVSRQTHDLCATPRVLFEVSDVRRCHECLRGLPDKLRECAPSCFVEFGHHIVEKSTGGCPPISVMTPTSDELPRQGYRPLLSLRGEAPGVMPVDGED